VSLPVLFEDEADAEYRAAARWYEERQVGLGTEFLDEVDVALDRIARFPGIGSPAPQVSTNLSVRRVPVRRFPYHVIYLHVESMIRVLAIAHTRQRPGYWKDRI
jgi:toxin ParE1/3/4